jgi:hypothetical protein
MPFPEKTKDGIERERHSGLCWGFCAINDDSRLELNNERVSHWVGNRKWFVES